MTSTASVTTRITWLDASRGLAIILLVLMHYSGALESRNFISQNTLDVIYGLLRISTPFFIFTFGFAVFITASKKIERTGLLEYYTVNVIKRLGYILLGREVIVIILCFRYPEMLDNVWSILLFQEFAKGGEILIFYFFAFLVAPLNVIFLQKSRLITYCTLWLVIYASSFLIGLNLVDNKSNNILRFLFYDVYAFFPFLVILATAMLMAKKYIESPNRERFVRFAFLYGAIITGLGFGILYSLSDDVWMSLANERFKKPPHPGYILFYLGQVFMIVCLVAMFISKVPRLINNILSLLGRNTLVSYVAHYTFFASVPIAAMLGGGVVWEVSLLILIVGVCYLGISLWDAHKTKRAKSISIMKV